MSSKEKSALPPGWVAERLRNLRQILEKPENLPAKADALWLDLAHVESDYLDEADEAMISIVVSDVLQGVDITRHYPDFYRKMLGNSELFQAFIEAVEILEADRAGTLEEVPVSEFRVPPIPQVPPQPEVEESRFGRWSVIWRQTAERLEGMFKLPDQSLNLAFRSGRGLWETGSTTLIRGQAAVAGLDLAVLLTADGTDDPDVLQLNLMVADLGWSSAGFSAGSLKATIRWGQYNETGIVNEVGEILLPPLLLEAVLDESGHSLAGNLQLRLEPVEQSV
jgi:hypothetical protein